LWFLVAHAKPAVLEKIVESVALAGQSEQDVPLLILALGQCRGSRTCEAKVSAALRRLSGLALAEGTSAKSWEEHWH
jgi:hypothetical protein